MCIFFEIQHIAMQIFVNVVDYFLIEELFEKKIKATVSLSVTVACFHELININ